MPQSCTLTIMPRNGCKCVTESRYLHRSSSIRRVRASTWWCIMIMIIISQWKWMSCVTMLYWNSWHRLTTQVVKLQAAIKYAEEDLPNCQVCSVMTPRLASINPWGYTMPPLLHPLRPPLPTPHRRWWSSVPAMTPTQSTTWAVCCSR